MLLRDKDRQRLIEIFSTLSIPVEIWAYGSRVNGTAHEASDLDLVIITSNQKNIPIDILIDIKEKIVNSNIPILVDLFDWARLPETFHKNILACHEVLFTNTESILNEPPADYDKK
jgi:predicted nucleotidyltransferase